MKHIFVYLKFVSRAALVYFGCNWDAKALAVHTILWWAILVTQ